MRGGAWEWSVGTEHSDRLKSHRLSVYAGCGLTWRSSRPAAAGRVRRLRAKHVHCPCAAGHGQPQRSAQLYVRPRQCAGTKFHRAPLRQVGPAVRHWRQAWFLGQLSMPACGSARPSAPGNAHASRDLRNAVVAARRPLYRVQGLKPGMSLTGSLAPLWSGARMPIAFLEASRRGLDFQCSQLGRVVCTSGHRSSGHPLQSTKTARPNLALEPTLSGRPHPAATGQTWSLSFRGRARPASGVGSALR